MTDIIRVIGVAEEGVWSAQASPTDRAEETAANPEDGARDGWRPIETAPAGEPILLWLDPPLDTSYACGYSPMGALNVVVGWGDADYYRAGNRWTCGWCEEGTADTEGHSSAMMMTIQPTHWMPLPEPPK